MPLGSLSAAGNSLPLVWQTGQRVRPRCAALRTLRPDGRLLFRWLLFVQGVLVVRGRRPLVEVQGDVPRPRGIFFGDDDPRQGRPAHHVHSGAALKELVSDHRANAGLGKQVSQQVGVLQRTGGVDDGEMLRHCDCLAWPGHGRVDPLTGAASAWHWEQPCPPSGGRACPTPPRASN